MCTLLDHKVQLLPHLDVWVRLIGGVVTFVICIPYLTPMWTSRSLSLSSVATPPHEAWLHQKLWLSPSPSLTSAWRRSKFKEDLHKAHTDHALNAESRNKRKGKMGGEMRRCFRLTCTKCTKCTV